MLADLVICNPEIVENNEVLYDLKPAVVMVGGQVVHWDTSQGNSCIFLPNLIL